LLPADAVPSPILADLTKFEWDTPLVKVNYALSHPVPWRARDLCAAGTVHLGVGEDGLVRWGADLATGVVPRNPFLLFGQMTVADTTRSPAGTESAWAYTHLPHGKASNGAADQLADLVDDTIEAHAPGFRASIAGRQVQRPSDLESADANLVGGAVNGGTAQLHQQLVFRPLPGLGGPQTPVRGLYLASAGAHPGGGVHGACGANAARAALAQNHIRGRLRFAVNNRLQR
jgi:phytoene dehydrogenase-like protein